MSEWRLENFEGSLDRWIDLEKPDDDLRYLVTEWLLSRLDDPYQGVSRAPDSNLWFGQVPGSEHGPDAVACSYWIREQDKVVRCDSIATLRSVRCHGRARD